MSVGLGKLRKQGQQLQRASEFSGEQNLNGQLERPTHKKLERPKQGYPDRLGKPTQLERPRKPARLRNNIHNYDSHPARNTLTAETHLMYYHNSCIQCHSPGQRPTRTGTHNHPMATPKIHEQTQRSKDARADHRGGDSRISATDDGPTRH